MQLHSFERRNSYIFFAIPIQTHELFFAPPGIYIYGSVLVNEMPKSARYHIDRANSIVSEHLMIPLG